MSEAGYFGDPSVIRSMSEEHRFLWASLFRACGPLIRPGMRVLDFGCGNGAMLEYLLRGDAIRWSGCRCSLAAGIDLPALDGELAAAAARLGPEQPVIFTSAAPVSLPGQFDLVLSHEVIYLIPDLDGAFRGLHAALAPGGALALATGCHLENPLYRRWINTLAREGVRAHPYRIDDYVAALRCAGFTEIDETAMRMDATAYDAWVHARGNAPPNADWFATPEEERAYYTEFGKALLFARRAPAQESSIVEGWREGW